MDALGSYDSEGEQDSSSPMNTNYNVHSAGLRDKATREKPAVTSDPAEATDDTKQATTKKLQVSEAAQQSYKHADIETMDLHVIEPAQSLSSKIHSSYYKATILQPVKGDTNQEIAKKQDIAIPSAAKGAILSVEIGTRQGTKGILCVSGSEAEEVQIPAVNQKEAENLEAAAKARLKSRFNEHSRNPEDMVMVNYPVDHPMHKTVSEVTKKALESYGKKGKNFMELDAESVGGIYVTPCGLTEKTYYDDASFDEQHRLGDLQVAMAHKSSHEKKRRRRLAESEMDTDEAFGPWLPYEEDELPVADASIINPSEVDEKPKLPTFEKSDRKMSHAGLAFPSCAPDVAGPLNEVVIEEGKMETKYDGIVVSTFHKKVEKDAQPTRSWLLPPKNIKMVDPETHKTFLPKKEIHTYTGHSMAVQAIRYIPKTGHCLLSASMDGFVKIWDANNNRRCLRTYKGHCKGVRTISFANPEGSKFYSCGFDSTVIQWDTEYGKVIGVHGIDSTPFCVTVYPKDENVFIVGGANKKGCQFDARTGKIELEYNAHQSTVNTFTFFDGDRKLVSTGDDKRIAVWEYNIPVPIKQISDPSMHNMPAVVVHPSEKFVLAQAMSNQILVYESSGSRFRFFGGKRFKGHICSGYSIRPECSPDGKYVVSGDVRGRVYLWDWKTCRNLSTLDGHKSVTMDCQWHPLQPSRLATCSWDGTIKLWD